MRIFAGPNGSGKTTIINEVRNHKVNGVPVDLGIYINADEIAVTLNNKPLSFSDYKVETSDNKFKEIVFDSGLINKNFTKDQFQKCYQFSANAITLLDKTSDERLAQILADFLRKKLLKEKRKFSFETVFSHKSKLDIIRQAVKAGYKVYLYFVSTSSPEINKYRVQVRVAEGGHNVPPDKIEKRYYRSLDLLFEAAQLSYQAYFFDNSEDGEKRNLFAHFKKTNAGKAWDKYNPKKFPDWFVKYYVEKMLQ